jgi:hypothetical protein
MKNGRSFGEREEELLERFAHRCPLALTPQQLIDKWSGIDRKQIAMLCQTDISRVNRWLSEGRSQEKPSRYYSQLLALFDIFLEFHEQLPETLISRYCNRD